MKARTISVNSPGIWGDVKQVAERYSIGVSTARSIGEKSGAMRRVGRRVIFNYELIDKYLDELAE